MGNFRRAALFRRKIDERREKNPLFLLPAQAPVLPKEPGSQTPAFFPGQPGPFLWATAFQPGCLGFTML